MTGNWFTCSPRPTGSVPRLVCFPHAGGGSAFFHPWRKELEADVEVCPVVLPGRESRFREPPYRRMDDLVEALFEGVRPYLDRPYAFLGHSLGAAVAFELARRLRSAGYAGPDVLFVSARRAPQERDHLAPVSTLSDESLVRNMAALGGTPSSILAHKDLFALFTQPLRADLEINESYCVDLAGPLLSCPVVALSGDGDPLVAPAELDSWRHVTSGPFERHVFGGDHFYLAARTSAVADVVRARLAPTAASGPV